MRTLQLISMLLLLAACAADAPIPTTPSPGYPCGHTWHSCGGGMCCANTDVCGAEHTGCPPGACCYVGDTSPRFGARAPSQQKIAP
jgi:hypothetical protein